MLSVCTLYIRLTEEKKMKTKEDTTIPTTGHKTHSSIHTWRETSHDPYNDCRVINDTHLSYITF